jgi:hypothetical protein
MAKVKVTGFAPILAWRWNGDQLLFSSSANLAQSGLEPNDIHLFYFFLALFGVIWR